MKIIDRLAAYIAYKGISLNAFDRSIGAANGYIGKQIKNNASVGVDMIEKIISVYDDLSLEWLITGNGSMLKLQEVKEPPQEYNTGPVIEAQRETISAQRKYISRLEADLEDARKKLEEKEKEKPVEDGQKRKAV